MANNASLSVLLTGTDKLTPTIKNAQKALTELNTKGSKLDSVQKNFDKITNSSAPLSKKIRDIKKQMETLIVTGQRETAEGKKMWEEMAKAARQYDDQLKQIQKDTKSLPAPGGGKGFDMKGMMGGMADKAGLGQMGAALANPYVLAGAAAVGAAKAVYDYGVELDRTLQKTAQFTGLSGNELQSLRAGIKSVATTWGKDYDTVLSSVDGLMSQFGISAEEALQIVRNGFASGADDSGRMLDMISRYSGAFHDAGISADELVAIIQNTRSGIFSEDGMELFSKGATKIREFSDKLRGSLEAVGINADQMYQKLQSGEITTVQAIQQISLKLKELPPQSQEVGDVLKQVFGKDGAKAGYEMVTALADVETNLETIMDGLTEDQKATLALQEATRDFEAALGSLFGTANGGFSTMTTKLKTEVYGAVAKVINGFIEWYNKSLIVRAGVASIALQFKNAWAIIKAILKIFINTVKSLAEAIEGVLTLDWNKVKNGWKNGIEGLVKNVGDGFANIRDNVEDAVDQIKNGQIEMIKAPSETGSNSGGSTVTTTGTGKGTGTGSGTGNKSGKPNKTEVVKTELEIKQEELKKVQNTVKDAFSNFNLGHIEKDELETIVKAANDYFEANNIKLHYDLEFFTNGGGFEQVKEAVKKDALTPLQELEEAYKKAQNELASVDPTKIPREQLEELKENARNAKKAVEDMKKALSTEEEASVASIQAKDRSKFAKGSSEDKYQSYQNTMSEINAIGSRVSVGALNYDEAKAEVDALIEKLKSETGLEIDVKFNKDGSFEEIKNEAVSVKDAFGMAGQAMQGFGQALSSIDPENEGLQKGALIAQAIGQLALGFAQAMASPASTAAGIFGWIAGGISGVATLAAMISQLQSFSTGGVVAGGNYTGDHVLARLNSGEGVLTRRGMHNLNNVMDQAEGGSAVVSGKVNFEIDGTKLKGVLNNTNRKLSKQS